jgi:hypothetical protein
LAGEIEDVIVSAALVRHVGDDEPEAGPVVELLVDEVQLTRTVAHEHGGERGTQAAAAGVQFSRGRHGGRPRVTGRLLSHQCDVY